MFLIVTDPGHVAILIPTSAANLSFGLGGMIPKFRLFCTIFRLWGGWQRFETIDCSSSNERSKSIFHLSKSSKN
jgi:hypothetical protein